MSRLLTQRWSKVFAAATLICASFLISTAHADYVTEVIDGVEWTTNKGYPAVGSSKAVKGGELTVYIQNYVPTLRRRGPNSRRTTITDVYELTHETLLRLHPETLEWIPRLATHWRILDNNREFWFRLNPKARFSDGSEITADDVLATWEHCVNPDIKDPSARKTFLEGYEKPVVHDKYTISVRTKTVNWRLMLYFAEQALPVVPAKQARMPADVYLDKFNWQMLHGSGPYILKPEDIKQDEALTLTRREDYWGWDETQNQGIYNFDRIKFLVVRDRSTALEKFKAGEFDIFKVYKSQRWVEETQTIKQIQKGWIHKTKVWNELPNSIQGYFFNMRTWPFDDKNVRLAFFFAYNRELLMEKYMFGEYEFMDSNWPGQIWANPNIRPIRYNPDRAVRLLERAGYAKLNEEGVRVHKDTGKALEFTLEYGDPGSTRIHKVVAEGLMKAGIKMHLKVVDYNALIKRVGERDFIIHYQNFRGILYPNPDTSWSSALADKLDNNNITGYKNKRVDELMDEYNVTFETSRQIEIIHEIDKLICKEYPVALSWFGPNVRMLYWNRFGMPETLLTRRGDDSSSWSRWWWDADKAKALGEAMKADTALPKAPAEVDPWGVKARLKGGDK